MNLSSHYHPELQYENITAKSKSCCVIILDETRWMKEKHKQILMFIASRSIDDNNIHHQSISAAEFACNKISKINSPPSATSSIHQLNKSRPLALLSFRIVCKSRLLCIFESGTEVRRNNEAWMTNRLVLWCFEMFAFPVFPFTILMTWQEAHPTPSQVIGNIEWWKSRLLLSRFEYHFALRFNQPRGFPFPFPIPLTPHKWLIDLLRFLSLSISFQASFYSTALKTLISVSTVILLGLIVAYHALEVQVKFGLNRLKIQRFQKVHKTTFNHLVRINKLRGAFTRATFDLTYDND